MSNATTSTQQSADQSTQTNQSQATASTQQSTSANASWFGEIAADRPQEFKDWIGNKQFTNADEALWSQYNLEKLLGHEKADRTVVLPKDEKDADGMKAFRAKMGIPESADQYELPVLPGTENDAASNKFRSSAANWLLQAGVPKTAAQTLVKSFDEYFANEVKEQQAQEQAKSVKELDQLKGEWGDKFDQNSEFARRFLKQVGWDDAKLQRFEATFGTASMLKDFYSFGAKLGEAGFIKGDNGAGNEFGLSLPQAKEKIELIRQDRAAGRITDAQWAHGKAEGKHAEFVRLNELVQRMQTGA